MKSLYRRYRPLKLADVVGQEQVTKSLENSLKSGKVGHAYLFTGPRGCGKTSVARIFAHEVNGFQYKLEDDYVDIIEIDGASNRGIDNIRELREKVAIAPTAGKYKIYIIDEVHMLTKEAFNALLKTLEEPPEHAIFIMATTDAYKVPITITSRAQTFTFRLADEAVMVKYLEQIAKQEKIKIDEDALLLIARRGGGSFRDCLSLLDQISTISDQKITREMVIGAMGLPQDEKIRELLSCYASDDVVKITAIIKDLLVSGVKTETLAEEMIAAIVREPEIRLMPLLEKLPSVRAPYAEAKLIVAMAEAKASPAANNFTGSETPHTDIKNKQPAQNGSDQPDEYGVNKKQNRGLISKTESKEDIRSNDISTFDWDNFAHKVQKLSDAVYSQLKKTEYGYDGVTLHIYPKKKIVKTILARDNNKRILVDAASGTKITIHEAGETPNNIPKDATLSKISAIMGGEVINDGGNNPFK